MRISYWSSDVCSSDLIALDVLLYPEHLDPVAAVGEHVADALVGGHQLALLVDDHAVERLGEPDAALVGLDLAGQQPEQRGLARTVGADHADPIRSEEHTSELQSLMRISYARFCLKKNTTTPQKS